MRRKQNPPAFGGAPIVSKTPSPPPTEKTSGTPLPPHTAVSAPLPHKAISMARAASFEVPTLFDFELDQIANLPRQYLDSLYHNAVFIDLMRAYRASPSKFLEKANRKEPANIVKKYAASYGSNTTLRHIENILKSITKNCTHEFDLLDRITFLVEALQKNENLAFMLEHSTYGTYTTLNEFTQSYRQLSSEKQQYVSDKMIKVINALPYKDILNLSHLLAYASRPNIPGEELPRLPPEATEAIAYRLNHPPKDLSELKGFLTDYLEEMKKITPDTKICNKILADFCVNYCELKLNNEEKNEVSNFIIKRIKSVPTANMDHLHAILDFAASNLPENKHHIFPPEILLIISDAIHNRKQTVNLASVFPQIIKLTKQPEHSADIQYLLLDFQRDYRALSSAIKSDVASAIAENIYILGSDDFNSNRGPIKLIQQILSNSSVDEVINKRIEFEEKIKLEDDAQLRAHSNAFNSSSLTTVSLFSVDNIPDDLPNHKSEKKNSFKNQK